MLRSKYTWATVAALLLVGWLLMPGISSGRRPQSTKVKAPSIVRDHLDGDVNYFMIWEPGAPTGPDFVQLNWRTSGYITKWQPYYHNFSAEPGTPIVVNAKQIPKQGRQVGWITAWLFDRKGNQLDQCGPTDAINGCTVSTHVPPR